MKRLRHDKVKRGRIILSAILTFLTAVLSLCFGGYLGYVTLNINYLTIGTMTPYIGGLLVVAGFFIFFGCIGGVISLKEIFISSRNEEKFSAYKGALISAIVYYIIIAIISIVGIIISLISYVPSSYTWTITAFSFFSLSLCGGAFYCVIKELKEHKKKKRLNGESAIANMNLNASDIHKLSNTRISTSPSKNNENSDEQETKVKDSQTVTNSNPNSNINSNANIKPTTTSEYANANINSTQTSEYANANINSTQTSEYAKANSNGLSSKSQTINQGVSEDKNQQRAEASNQGVNKDYNEDNFNKALKDIIEQKVNKKLSRESNEKPNVDLDFVTLAEKLMQLEELRKAGLINDQEYQTLKQKCI